MRTHWHHLREVVLDTFWFLPALLAAAAAVGAFATVSIDHSLSPEGEWMRGLPWVWWGGPEGARAVLSVVAGSTMTVLSIVFSLTMTTLAQTASHFGSRVLRNFTSDRGVQLTLGTFIAAFVYSLLVLRTVRSADGATFVPFLSVNIGLGLALVALGALIFFIHRVSNSIQAENLIADISRDFSNGTEALFCKHPAEAPATPPSGRPEFHVVSADVGYVQRVNEDRLVALAAQHDLEIRILTRPGEFIGADTPLVAVAPLHCQDDRLEGALRACFGAGSHRTPHQDPRFPAQQIAEVVARALSPGINEPFTALACLDWLGWNLRLAARHHVPSPVLSDHTGRPRVWRQPVTLTDLATVALRPIRLYAAGQPEVTCALAAVIEKLGPLPLPDETRALLRAELSGIEAEAARLPHLDDRHRVEAACARAWETLATAGGE